jgi:hypothetical protein
MENLKECFYRLIVMRAVKKLSIKGKRSSVFKTTKAQELS